MVGMCSSGWVNVWLLCVICLYKYGIGSEAEMVQVKSAEEAEAYLLYNHGVEREGRNGSYEAEGYYIRALELKPDLLQAHNNLGCICNKRRNDSCAEIHFGNLLRLSEEKGDREMLAAAYNNLALLRFEQHKHDQLYIYSHVLPMYDQALLNNPMLHDAIYNRAAALQALGDEQSAFPLYTKLLQAQPKHVGAHTNLGNLYLKLNRYTEAIEHYTIAATHADGVERENALNNLGQAYKEFGDGEMALRAFEAAQRIHEGRGGFSVATLNILVTKRMLCDWADWDQLHAKVYQEMAHCSQEVGFIPSPYETMLMPGLDRLVPSCSRAQLAHESIKQYESMALLTPLESNHGASSDTLIRLGYLSYDMNNHPMGHLTYGLLANHNRSGFHVGVYSYGHDDRSVQREKIINASDDFVDLSSVSDLESAKKIRDDDIEVLFDLMAHTRGARVGIVAARPSTIIVNYLGYPGTSGFGPSRVGYLLADQQVLPPESLPREITENAFYLPNSYQANSYDADLHFCPTARGYAYFAECQAQLRVQHLGRAVKDAVVFANLNTITKLEPASFALWMRIMRRVPKSVLWLLEPKGKAAHVVQRNLRSYASSHGIDPDRIAFASRVSKEEHISRLPAIDLFLDTLTYGAHSTAADVLWSGVPLVTLRGQSFPSRVGLSILTTLGMEDLVAYSMQEYEELAVRIADNHRLRIAIRGRLGRQIVDAPFFFPKVITRYVEAAAKAMIELKRVGFAARVNWVVKDKRMDKDVTSSRREQLFQVATGLHRRGDVERAKHIYHRLLEGEYRVADIWHLLGLAEENTRSIHQAIKLNPDAVLYKYNLGHMLRKKGDVSGAMNAYLQALSLALAQRDMQLCQIVETCAWMSVQEPKEALLVVQELNRSWQTLKHSCERSASLVSALEDLGKALLRVGAIEEASVFLQRSVELSPAQDQRYAQRLYALGSAYTKAGNHGSALDVHYSAVRLEHSLSFSPMNVPSRPDVKPTLAIYCYEYGQSWWPKWGPDSPTRGGVGGSEEAVIFLGRELAAWYHVEVYADPREEFYGKLIDGVLWMPHTAFDVDRRFDVFVAWRYHISLALARSCVQKFLWLQDMVNELAPQIELQQQREELHGVFVLSKFHKRMFAPAFRQYVHITPNALDERFFVDGANKKTELIYASSPNRGLEQVLRLWPYLLSAAPDIHLRVYYGFTKSFITWGEANMRGFKGWLRNMKELLKQPHVHYYGLVQHEVLAEAYANAGFALYPTSFPETGCVSLMKAQAMGAIPITSRYEHSTLPELCGLWDLGPPAQNGSLSENEAWQLAWADSVITAVQLEDLPLDRHRRRMKAWARRELLWSAVAAKWHSIFQSSK